MEMKMTLVITEERRNAIDLALGLKKLEHKELSLDEQMYVLEVVLARYATKEMLPFKPLWDLASKRAENVAFGRTHEGERILSKEIALASQPWTVSKGSVYWVLEEMLGTPEPVKAEFWGADNRLRNEPRRPKAGEEYESETALVGSHGNVLHWKAVWKAEECAQYKGLDGQKYAERAITWRAIRSELFPLSNATLAAMLGGKETKLYSLLWGVANALSERRRDLESRLERFNEREQGFYETVASFGGPKRH